MDPAEGKGARKLAKDIGLLATFIGVYCREKHSREKKAEVKPGEKLRGYIGEIPGGLCPDCRKLLFYAAGRRLRCPHEPKPSCKRCQTHCYRGPCREKIKAVMRFSGRHLIRKGRVDLLGKYLF